MTDFARRTSAALILAVLFFLGQAPGGPLGPGSPPSQHAVFLPGQRAFPRHLFPKLFIQIQSYIPSASLLTQAADWHLLVLDAELASNRPEFLGPAGRIRTLNPSAVILFYFSAADVIPGNTANVNAGFQAGLKDGDFMKDAAGSRYFLYKIKEGLWTQMLNLTTRVNTYLPAYLKTALFSKGLGDGIFYDWITEEIAWLNTRSPNPNAPLDIDNDGAADSGAELDSSWVRGTKSMLASSRRTFPPGTLIVGNGGWAFDDTYKGYINGRMVENFLDGESSGFDWHRVLRGHLLMHKGSLLPKVSLIMGNGAKTNFRFMRFALSSTLMFDGYFAYTNKGAYQKAWWYDEYAVDRSTGKAVRASSCLGWLGSPKGAAYDAADKTALLQDYLIRDDRDSMTRVWRRDFTNGTVLVNPSGKTQVVALGAAYRKIMGVGDPATNDGKTVSSVELGPRSGLILIK